jgi:hypothetical protein
VSSNAKKRQTLAKVARERAVREKRALKQEKRELRKQARAEGVALENDGASLVPDADVAVEGVPLDRDLADRPDQVH